MNVSVETSEASRVLDAMPGGVVIPASAVETVERDGQIRLWWGDVPIDLFFRQHDFHRQVAIDTTAMPFLDGEIPVISATHLAVFKALFNRSRDWVDIESMLAAESVDGPVALDWVRRLVGTSSASFIRLAELVDRVSIEAPPSPGSEMDRPLVDWRRLGQ